MKKIIVLLLTAMSLSVSAQTHSFNSPVPTENQLRWQDMEMYAFIHYSLNTYTDQEWGFGNEDLNLFNPSNLDCRQWARVCKQASIQGIVQPEVKTLWWQQPEIGTAKLTIDDAERSIANVRIPADAAGQKLHLVCEVSDQGAFQLKSYIRIIIDIDN